MMDSRIKTKVMDEIVEIGAPMEDMGLVNTSEKNLSIKDGDLLYITPGGTSKKKPTHDNICVFDESAGEKLWGERPSSETKMHRGAYTVKEGFRDIIYCRTPYLTAHAVTHVPLDLRCHSELPFHFKDISVAPYGIPGSDEITENTRPYLLHRDLVLMANHGVLSIASNLALACQRVMVVKKFAGTMYITRQIGKPVDIPGTGIHRLLGRELEL